MTAIPENDVVLYGFHRSTYVSVARLVLHAKAVSFAFHDAEEEMYSAAHLGRHPFGRAPVLRHGDFWLYETSAIALYVDEQFTGPPLQPSDVRRRAKMHQWMSNLNGYFYPYMIYYLVHERVVFPDLGIAPEEAIVAASLPKIEQALAVLEAELAGADYVVGDEATLADYFLLPTLTALGFAPEGAERLARCTNIRRWLAQMGERPEVVQFRATLPPRAPIEHARRWASEHRPLIKAPAKSA
jgi:glutathione S-transferase